jgi:hypothetical protein
MGPSLSLWERAAVDGRGARRTFGMRLMCGAVATRRWPARGAMVAIRRPVKPQREP